MKMENKTTYAVKSDHNPCRPTDTVNRSWVADNTFRNSMLEVNNQILMKRNSIKEKKVKVFIFFNKKFQLNKIDDTRLVLAEKHHELQNCFFKDMTEYMHQIADLSKSQFKVDLKMRLTYIFGKNMEDTIMSCINTCETIQEDF